MALPRGHMFYIGLYWKKHENTGPSSAFRKWYGALGHRWCWPSVDGTRGEDERGVDPLVRGVWGTSPKKIL